MLRHGTASMRAFGSRWHLEIPRRKVVAFNFQALADGVRMAAHRNRTTEWIHREYLRIGRTFDENVVRQLKRSDLTPDRDAFFAFNTGALETLQYLRERRVFTVLDQIDPGKVEEEMVAEEDARWPGWQRFEGRVPQEYWDRMKAEWMAADLVVVNSEWSKTALIQQGVPDNKVAIVPVAYEPEFGPVPVPLSKRQGPLTVLWLGSVILRKGIQYLIEAAKLLKNSDLRIVVAGPIGISEQAVASAPANMKFVGRVLRSETHALYESAHVFVLPTVSDGFAVTQVEAMARGLPVITTPNCGRVVTDGVDGLIVPARDAKALAAAIARLDSDRALLAEMSHHAFIRSTQFLLPSQARQVEAAVQSIQESGTAEAPQPVGQ